MSTTHNDGIHDAPKPGAWPGAPTPPKKKGWLRRNAGPIAVGAGILAIGWVIGVGSASAASTTAAAEPAPVKTVTVEVPAKVTDTGCREVAEELFSMLQSQTERVVIPLAAGGSEGIEAIIDGRYSDVDAAVEKINGANAEIQTLTSRAAAIRSDYERCINP